MTYSSEEIIRVWEMAPLAFGYNRNYVRRDICGALIELNQYGNRNSNYGWEIDHIIPTSRGGLNTYNNVQPLHWKNNSSKGDGSLTCSVGGT